MVPASPNLKFMVGKGQYNIVGSLHLFFYEMQILYLHVGRYVILFKGSGVRKCNHWILNYNLQL